MAKGVILINLGTPDDPSTSSVRRYLKQFLLDPRVIDINPIARHLLVRGIIAPFRAPKSAKGYQKLWTPQGSPLKHYGEVLAKGVQAHLGEDYVVELAMRYQSPSIQSALDKMMQRQVTELIVLPLFPQYASASTGSALEEVMRCMTTYNNVLPVKMIQSYPTNEVMLNVFADNAKALLNEKKYDHILFSFHGLPQRQLRKGDLFNHCLKSADCCQNLTPKNQFCYTAQCVATAKGIAQLLDLKPSDYTVCYQSGLGKDPWTRPYTADVIKERAEQGLKNMLVFSPAFVADCLETLIEIREEYQEEWEHLGGEKLQLVPSLNDNPKWIAEVAAMVRNY